MWNSKLNVQAIFKSLDGEVNGHRGAGQLTTFIRLKGCNLNCKYCDTKYSQEAVPPNWMTVKEIVEKVGDASKITITGGEPLLQFIELPDLLNALLELRPSSKTAIFREITIETNGSITTKLGDGSRFDIWNSPKIRYVVDYKLPSSGMEHKMEVGELACLRKTDIIKFVIAYPDDYDRALEVIAENPGWQAQLVFSPAASIVWDSMGLDRSLAFPTENPIPRIDTAWPRELAEMMIRDKLQNIQYSLQIHKVLWPGAKEER
jgi:7-carboxy-7-deazaguanine synthase